MPDVNDGHALLDPAAALHRASALAALLDELKTGLLRYRSAAAEILDACGVRLRPPDAQALSLAGNFFSLVFLYAYRRAGIDRERRILYATTLQCLRGMVTGCDNLLDDEYKPTLDTDIPDSGVRFRSVVDIMVSDRVLFRVLSDAATQGLIPRERVLAAVAASMQTMMRSGVEEAAEEAGVSVILAPDEILRTVHHFKTGILFQCPWDIPRILQTFPETSLDPLLEGLYNLGTGCQVLDDMVDLDRDVHTRRHNYLVSLIYHGADAGEREHLVRRLAPGGRAAAALDIRRFPVAARSARQTARRLMTDGLGAIFADTDQDLLPAAIHFLENRIGVPPAMPDSGP